MITECQRKPAPVDMRDIYAPHLEMLLPHIAATPLEAWVRPSNPKGLYFLADERGVVIYIGQTINVMQRFGWHLSDKKFHSAWFIPLNVTRAILKEVETCAIIHFRPRLNYAHRENTARLYCGSEARPKARRIFARLLAGEL